MNYRNLLFSFVLFFILIAAKSDLPKEFTFKNFEKTLAKVQTNLYASKYEVTNLQYTTFLKELKAKGMIQEYATAKLDTFNWTKVYKNKFVEIYHTDEAFKNYPVVNVSYQGAKMFCEWMTKKYNEYPKREFKKVKFRLPNEQEWIKAAKGGLKGVTYPWGSYCLQNKKGCYLANFYSKGDGAIHYDKEKKEYVIIKDAGCGYINDKSDITVPVDMYSENDIGIYNISGNAKEMLQEPGKVKGGGWLSTGYDIRIDVIDTYEKPAVDIGFRYFVEIIEF